MSLTSPAPVRRLDPPDAATVVRALAAGLPTEALVTDPDLLESYRYDRARFCPAGVPAAVVLARETAHVHHALRTASSLGVPVVPQGPAAGCPARRTPSTAASS
jgi:glycolate oxidase